MDENPTLGWWEVPSDIDDSHQLPSIEKSNEKFRNDHSSLRLGWVMKKLSSYTISL